MNVHALLGLLGGIALFIWGFFQLRKKQIIENIPTSKIRSMAMGLVEIQGAAVDWMPLTAPFTQKKCVFYHYQVQELRRSKNSSHWVTIKEGKTEQSPFFVTDDTGKVLINPLGANFDLVPAYQQQFSNFSGLPDHVTAFLEQNQVRFKTFFGLGTKTLKLIEYVIVPHEPVFIIGVCQNNRHQLAMEYRNRVNDRLKMLKQNPDQLAKFDQNKDGQISMEEWEVARQVIAQEVRNEEEQESEVFIGKGERSDQWFFISSKSEKSVLNYLKLKIALGVFGGPILTVACLFWLLS